MAKKLKQLEVENCGQLQRRSLQALQKEFGPKTGQTLYNFCRGIDDRQIKLEKERKSVSAEINYGIRFKEVGAFHFVCLLISNSHFTLPTRGMLAYTGNGSKLYKVYVKLLKS